MPRRALRVLALLLALTLPGHAALAVETFSEDVVMDDGVALHTLVSLPSGSGPFSTLLLRSPYQDDILSYLEMVTAFGYAVVIQDTRGTGQSEGEIDVFFSDAVDGLATVDWLVSQPWSDGTFSMWGASALGIPAYLLAPHAPEGMLCQAVLIATPDVYEHAVFHGGVFKEKDVSSWSSWIGASTKLDDLENHRLCDDYWDPVRVADDGATTRGPALHVGGWHDVFADGTLAGYQMFRESDDPDTAAQQYLLMGPWEHNKFGEARVGSLNLPEQAGLDLPATALEWLDFCHTGWPVSWPRVRYYVMGPVGPDGEDLDGEGPGNEWREAETWPVPSEETPLYLAGPEALGFEAPADGLTWEVWSDPADPSPTVGGRNLTLSAGPRDQVDVEARDDALVLTSAPLEEPLVIAGNVRASLWVSTEAPDGDVAVRVTDVHPDGRSMLVTEGIQRLSARDGCEAVAPVPAGLPMHVDVDLWSTAYAFPPGHRVRVVVTGTNHPRYEVNPFAYPQDPKTGDLLPITLTLHANAQAPSFLRLPVVPEEDPGLPPEPDPDPEPGPEPQPEPIPELQPEPDPIPEPQPEPGPEPQPEPQPETVVEPQPEPVADAGGDVAAEPVPDAAPDVWTGPDAEPDGGAAADAGPDLGPGSDSQGMSGGDDDGGGCGAAPSPAHGLGWAFVLIGLALVRRRRA